MSEWECVCLNLSSRRECVSDTCVCWTVRVWVCVSVTLCLFICVFTCMCVCVCVFVWQWLSDGSSIACSIVDRRWVSIAVGNGEVCVQSNVCWQARWTSHGYDDLNLLQVTSHPPPITNTHKLNHCWCFTKNSNLIYSVIKLKKQTNVSYTYNVFNVFPQTCYKSNRFSPLNLKYYKQVIQWDLWTVSSLQHSSNNQPGCKQANAVV